MFKAIFVVVIVVLSISTYLAQESDKKTGEVTSAKEIGRSSGSHIINLLVGIGQGFQEGYNANGNPSRDSIMKDMNKKVDDNNRNYIKMLKRGQALEDSITREQLKNYVRQ